MTTVDFLGYSVVIGLFLSLILSLPKIGTLVGWKTSALTLLVTFILYAFYEVFMPENMNIRVDRFFLWPALLFILLFVAIRINRLRNYKTEETHNH